MHGETDPRVTGFVEELRAAYGSAPAPAPSPSLATLFAEGTAVAPDPRRRQVKHGLKAVPGKVAAGLVGLLIGYTGLGVAGAVPGPLTLVADDTEQVEQVVLEEEVEQEDVVEEEVVEEEDEAEPKTPANLADVPVPTSVSEAAHNHAFDEACGNHGAYVSHFARFGTEPECATNARAAAAGNEQTVEAADEDGDAGDKKAKKAKAAKAKKAKKAKKSH